MKTIARNSDVTLVKLCPAIFQTFNYKIISRLPVKWKIPDLVKAILSNGSDESNCKVRLSFYKFCEFIKQIEGVWEVGADENILSSQEVNNRTLGQIAINEDLGNL